MREIFWTKEQEWLDKWDSYILQSNKGHYLQFSDWVKSYQVYGFGFNLLLVKENGRIIGGASVVVAKFAIFKLLVVPYGPLLEDSKDLEGHSDLCNRILEYSRHIGACYTQMNLPIASEKIEYKTIEKRFLNNDIDHLFSNGTDGSLFNQIISIHNYGFVDLYPKDSDSYALIRNNYNTRTKRAIKSAEKFEAQVLWAKNEDEIEKVYEIISENAKLRKYSVRNWEAFKETILNLHSKGLCEIPYCIYNKEVLGGLLLLKSANKFSYIMGGTKKSIKGLNVGHLLQNEAIKLSLKSGYEIYDIGVSGSEGVREFKRGFGTVPISTCGLRYWVHNNIVFGLFLSLYKLSKKHKKRMEKVLLAIKRLKYSRN